MKMEQKIMLNNLKFQNEDERRDFLINLALKLIRDEISCEEYEIILNQINSDEDIG